MRIRGFAGVLLVAKDRLHFTQAVVWLEVSFQVDGDKITLLVDGRDIVYRRKM
jgi:hypothetical protein